MTQPYTVEDFHFWLPIDKARVDSSRKDAHGKPLRYIRGVASTPDQDLQGEVLHQDGIDFKYFLKHGYFNNDHKPGFENKVGEPTQAQVRDNKFYVEGFLYNNHPVADSIWKLMLAQESTPNAKRKVGFSVQGKVKRRMGKQILGCWVQDVAVTTAPINTKTWAEVVKSLSTGYSTVNQTNGATLRTESLEAEPRSLLIEANNKRKLSKSMAVELLQEVRGLSKSTARLVVEAHFRGII